MIYKQDMQVQPFKNHRGNLFYALPKALNKNHKRICCVSDIILHLILTHKILS